MPVSRRSGCGVGIVGVGASLPARVRTNDAFPAKAGDATDFVGEAERNLRGATQARWQRWADDRFRGAVERRVIADDQESSDLEADACRSALACAGRVAADVDLLIGYSQVPDFPAPGNHGRVARKLGLPRSATAFTLDGGCASFLTHATTAIRSIQAGDHALALLYQSCAVSRVLNLADPAAPMLGDGGVAQLVGPVDPGLGLVGRVQLTRSELCDGLVLQASDGRPRWTTPGAPGTAFAIGAPDPRAAVAMGAEGVPYAREACALVLEQCGYTARDVDLFVCAQAMVWFGAACAEAIGVPVDRTVPPEQHFQRFGHLLAGSVSLNLYVAWATRRLQVGDLVLMYSPGVGFTQAATLLRWAIPPPSTLPAALLPPRTDRAQPA